MLSYGKGKKTNLYLNVYQKNVHAVHFYEREGFFPKSDGIDIGTKEKEFIMEWNKVN